MKKIIAALLLAVGLCTWIQSQTVAINAMLSAYQLSRLPWRTVTYASVVNFDVSYGGWQFCTLTGNITVNSTNRISTGNTGQRTILILTASGGDRQVTLNPNWKVAGTNAVFTILNGKTAYIGVGASGSTESTVFCAYDHAL